MCEVALVAIDLVNLKIVDEYSEIISPYKDGLEYSPEAERVHGLSLKHLTENGESVKNVYQSVKSFLTKYKNPRVAQFCVDTIFNYSIFRFSKDSLSFSKIIYGNMLNLLKIQ